MHLRKAVTQHFSSCLPGKPWLLEVLHFTYLWYNLALQTLLAHAIHGGLEYLEPGFYVALVRVEKELEGVGSEFINSGPIEELED